MHVSRILQSAISILPLLNHIQPTIAISPATPTATATATVIPPTATATTLEPEAHEYANGTLLEKRCANPCGYYSQLCCSSSESCSTNSNGQAECVSGSGGGSWQYFTTTYVRTETETATFTSTWSSYISAAPSGSSCDAGVGETICGDNCCGPAYVCYNQQCILGSTSIWATETEPATPAVRGTTLSTATHTASITTTQGFIAPVNTAGSAVFGVKASSDGLSGGAIAGIVIGTIAGVILLLLLCACLCCRGILDSLFACLGCGRKKRKETTYVEERYHRHSHGGARPGGRTWFGSRPAAGASTAGEKKKSPWSGLATIGIILGALAICLGLKRRQDHRDDDEKTDYTYPSSYYYYSDYYTNDGSEVTDDRRTRETRRSRRSRTRSRRS
ncbi:uncharacterized protein BO97DRAFT_401893 [Aspergillus homomorphus CBS 101889]|uniref:Uncharacterized protein n=1 Tax=Aspergillus homomorphus (strain CBS 101889) TaxID=1450537 RepID=A0A395IAH0_ASPHC|nr:hypothetical protein BO97DRAFT_401893 [Aspergillus homomorphus CBS 101889]RAL17212.1 hypothetical protein BO97DRAFT_401893 [Aspergillus homomorphus CBS 101889]